MVTLEQIRKVKADNEEEWMRNDPAITGVDIGHKLINGGWTPELAIRVLVEEKKVFLGETDSTKIIPSAILVDEAHDANLPFDFQLPGSLETLVEPIASGALVGIFQEYGYLLPDGDIPVRQDQIRQGWQITHKDQSFDITQQENSQAVQVTATDSQEQAFQLETRDTKLLPKRKCPKILKDAFLEHGKISLSEQATIEHIGDDWIVEDDIQVFGVRPVDNKVTVYPAVRTDVIVRQFDPQPSGSQYAKSTKELRPGMGLGGGSIGVVVQDRDSGQQMLLTCKHSLTDFLEDGNIPIRLQSETTPLAGRIRASEKLDCALVEIQGRHDLIPEIPGIGQVVGAASAVRGMQVRKYGRETHVTSGTVDTVDLTIRMKLGKDDVFLKGHIGIVTDLMQSEQFCDGGDSGSVIVNDAQEVVGLFVARSPDGKYGIAVPIQDVLDDLSVDIHVRERPGLDGAIDDIMREVTSTGNLVKPGPSALRVLQFLWGCCDCPRSPCGGG